MDTHGIFPLPYLMFFAGYCLVLLVDRVLAGEHGHSHSHGHHDHEDQEKAVINHDSEKKTVSPKQEGPIIQVEDFTE